ncbi:hypothetical protein CLOM_g13931 [Closterium sp. NIES-68]|nr:hypothetical protein CLOM_g13931 [Closterium sp. NIES-68]GJP76804.1 hypothetical protein CLOP_g7264 [Closterium sp. NIES-67]
METNREPVIRDTQTFIADKAREPSGEFEPSLEERRVGSSSSHGGLPECYVIVHNVAKRHNIGMLLRSATAFNVHQILVVGRRDFSAFGSHGAADHVSLKHFNSLTDAKTYLQERDCSICGVEIVDNARPIQSHPFSGNTAFLLGNEGTGLSPTELAVCDSFVYIPQHGPGTASLNVIVAASIVLHHFAVWARYPVREREGAKFSVAARPMRRGPRNRCPEDPAELAARRERRQEAADGDTWQDMEDGSLGLLEGEEGGVGEAR